MSTNIEVQDDAVELSFDHGRSNVTVMYMGDYTRIQVGDVVLRVNRATAKLMFGPTLLWQGVLK